MHICVIELLVRQQAITKTNVELLSTNFNDILIDIKILYFQENPFENLLCKMMVISSRSLGIGNEWEKLLLRKNSFVYTNRDYFITRNLSFGYCESMTCFVINNFPMLMSRRITNLVHTPYIITTAQGWGISIRTTPFWNNRDRPKANIMQRISATNIIAYQADQSNIVNIVIVALLLQDFWFNSWGLFH